ncbi:hypothetical protein [uncultured Dokdonia sp.]|uniref:hypothetical protein n=1 Tax=uncultured Dokdonia sp. TaxID=575653 RepID=UPI00260CE6BA|nr:hypothetical protein [uncultured Dokdonia sp.]
MNTQQINEGKFFLNDVFNKCYNDSNFKESLVNNPEKTLENYIGKELELPKNTQIKVEDQTNENVVFLNIPRKVEVTDLELTEEELESISGGAVFGLDCAAIAIGIAVGVIANTIDDAIDGAIDGATAAWNAHQ